MSIIKSFSVCNGDLFYINHGTDNFTIIDCNLLDETKEKIMDEICELGEKKGIRRFISTHPDEDHFHGIEYLDERLSIINFYCVKNEATKTDETSSFKRYCELRDDSKKAFYIYQGCSRKWMNQGDDEIGSAGINILWPKTDNEEFKKQLKIAKEGGNANNISPIIRYALNDGATVLWFGDLETDFMESIEKEVEFPKADIVFAPHHGRSSGKLPKKWLDQLSPKIIVIGESDSSMLDYYKGHNTVTQNTAKDIIFDCQEGVVHVYVSNEKYSAPFLEDKSKPDRKDGHYIGSFSTHNGN